MSAHRWLNRPVTGATCEGCLRFLHRGVRSVLTETGVKRLCRRCRNVKEIRG